MSGTVVGRCAAGYLGVLCDTKKVAFVKDAWHTIAGEANKEGKIVGRLLEKGVQHTPTVADLDHGNVPSVGMSVSLVCHTVRS